MSKTVVGVFENFGEAKEVAQELELQGYSHANVSVIANDHPEYSTRATGDGSEASTDASVGAALGGVTGLALGLVALAIPGIGPVIALGPLAAALTGAGLGAVAGGLIGAMTALGVPEEDAELYASHVKEGRSLVAVQTDEANVNSTVSMLESMGADRVTKNVRVYSHPVS